MEIHNSKLITINRIVEKRSNSNSQVDLRFTLDNNNNLKTITYKHLITGWEIMEDKETINSLTETSIISNSKITLDRPVTSQEQMIIISNSNSKLNLLNMIHTNNRHTNNIRFTFRI